MLQIEDVTDSRNLEQFFYFFSLLHLNLIDVFIFQQPLLNFHFSVVMWKIAAIEAYRIHSFIQLIFIEHPECQVIYSALRKKWWQICSPAVTPMNIDQPALLWAFHISVMTVPSFWPTTNIRVCQSPELNQRYSAYQSTDFSGFFI